MSNRAEIYIEDADPIGASIKFVFPDGFDPKSAAHQMCNVIRKLLDDLAANGSLTRLDDHVDEAPAATCEV